MTVCMFAELQTDNETEKIVAIRAVINKLPAANFDVLSYFIAHLYRYICFMKGL